ncbi:MAG: LysR family transcriptional regulator [Pseudomonadota bacterium]
MDRWSELRTALHVAEHGTVSAAAAALGYHRATVNRHIDALEEAIGARIFLRHTQGYTLTEIGEEVLRVAQTTQSMTDDLLRRVRGKTDQIEGEIRVTLLAPFAGLIMGAVDAFATRNPHCRVLIDASEDLAQLEYAEAHIAIRAGAKPDNPDYVVQSLGRTGLNLYAHDSYIARHGLPTGTGDLAGHRFVVPRDKDPRLPFWRWIDTHVTPEMVVVSANDIWVSIEAIARGVGLGFVADHEAETRPHLRPVLPPNRAWSVRLWLATHVDLHRTEKVQAMSREIKAAFDRT